METVDVKSILIFFKRNILILFITLLSFLLGGYIYLKKTYTPIYRSSTTILFLDSYEDEKYYLDVDLTNAYTRIIKSTKILNNTIESLNLSYDLTELSNKVAVNSINKAELIKISVDDKDAELACLIVNQISENFIEEIKYLYGFDNIKVIDDQQIAQLVQNNTVRNSMLKYSFLGIVLGSLIIIIKYYFDQSIKNVYDVKKMGYNVIGILNKKNKKRDLNIIGSIIKYNEKCKNLLVINTCYTNVELEYLAANVNNISLIDIDNDNKIFNDNNLNIKDLKKLVNKKGKDSNLVIITVSDLASAINLSKITNHIIVLSKFYKTSIPELEKLKNGFEQIGITNLDIIIDKD